MLLYYILCAETTRQLVLRVLAAVVRLEGKVDKLEGKVDQLEGKVDKLEGKVDKKFADVIQRIDRVYSTHHDIVHDTIGSLEKATWFDQHSSSTFHNIWFEGILHTLILSRLTVSFLFLISY